MGVVGYWTLKKENVLLWSNKELVMWKDESSNRVLDLKDREGAAKGQ